MLELPGLVQSAEVQEDEIGLAEVAGHFQIVSSDEILEELPLDM